MAFSDNFSGGLGHWTIGRWRSYTADEPGDPGHVLSCSDVSGNLDGQTNRFPPNDIFIGTGGKLFVGCGSQNYGDSVLRCDTKIDLNGTRVITVVLLVPPNNKLQGWPYLYVTDLPYSAPSMTGENSFGPTPHHGFCVRFNGGQNYDGSNFQPAPEVFTYDNYIESNPSILDSGHAPTISPTTAITAVLTITHSHLTITANGNTWFDANWTLNAAFTEGYVYIGSHNHASRKYSPFNNSYNTVFTSIAWDGPNYTAQVAYRVPDPGPLHTPPSEPQGYDVGWICTTGTPTLTVTGVPAGVTSARLVASVKADALSNPSTGFQFRYVLNGNAAVTVNFPYYSEAGSLMISTPLDVTKLVTGNNTLVITVLNGSSGWVPSVGNVQILAETVALGTLKLGTTTLKEMRVGTTKVLKAFLNSIQIWTAAPDPTAPLAPTQVAALPGNTVMALSWTAPTSDGGSPITDYTVEYRLSPSGTYTAFSHTASTATAITVTGLTNGTAYDFRISAKNVIGTGPASNVLTATPIPPALYADNFNRANGALGSFWTVVDTAQSMSISANKVIISQGGLSSYRYNRTFLNDQWAEADVTLVPGATGNAIGPCVRLGTAANTGVYFFNYDGASGAINVYRRDAGGNYAQVGSNVANSLSSFTVRLEAEGTTIRMFKNGTKVLEVTDTSVPVGQPGLLGQQYGVVPSVDNFRCGDLPYTP